MGKSSRGAWLRELMGVRAMSYLILTPPVFSDMSRLLKLAGTAELSHQRIFLAGLGANDGWLCRHEVCRLVMCFTPHTPCQLNGKGCTVSIAEDVRYSHI
jgi:hypothetical protein